MFGLFKKIPEDHIKPTEAFGSRKVCRKCGGKKFSRTFVNYRSIPECAIYLYEHIEAKCSKCGAIHWEIPKDTPNVALIDG